MVAPAYADARSTLAKTIGLGRKAPAAPETPAAQGAPAAGEQRGEEDHDGHDHDATDAVPAGKPGRRKADAA